MEPPDTDDRRNASPTQANQLVRHIEQLQAAVAGQQPVRNLTRQYVQRLFSPGRATDADFDPHQEWRQLRPVLLRRSVVHLLNRSRGEKQ